MQATITPRYIDPPKPGKTNYSVKDDTNVRWSVPPEEASRLQVGVPVSLDYRDNTFNDQIYHMVDAVQAAPGTPVIPTPAPVPVPATEPPPFVPQAPVVPPPAPAAPPPLARTATGIDKDAAIFVTGVIGRCFHGTGAMPDEEFISSMVKHLRRAFLSGMNDAP